MTTDIDSTDREALWWKYGVFYHIYIRSFFDSDDDGIGDLKGVIAKLDYLSYLGINAIWLSPFYSSPDYDYGYDITDYTGINPEYGTLKDFILLLNECHSRKIRVIMDLVLNHTSSLHPWFIEARSSVVNLHRDWYIWEDGTGKHPPNNWKSVTGGSAWEYDPITGQYYLHSFFPFQPDLNWRNNEMAEEVYRVMKYWLDMGVDGFRLDAFNLIIKDKQLRNNPAIWGIPFLHNHFYIRNRSGSVKIGIQLRRFIDLYPGRVLIGEIYTLPPGYPGVAAEYLAGNKGINLTFDFSLFYSTWNARSYFRRISDWYSKIPAEGWPCNVLSNHDLFRHINRFPWRRNKIEKAKVAAFLLLTIRGTPFIYYGEEIGMTNSRIRKKDLRDPLGKKFWPFFRGRDRARTPMQWTDKENSGFTNGIPWLPVNKNYKKINVGNLIGKSGSLFNVYRSLISLRNTYISLSEGNWVPLLAGENGVIIYTRETPGEQVLVILNFKERTRKLRLEDSITGTVLLSTCRDEKSLLDLQNLVLEPFEATILLRKNILIGNHHDEEFPVVRIS